MRSQPQVAYEQRSGVREALDSVPCMSVTTADSLLRALAPLLRLSAALRDSLLLVLRKALFSRSFSIDVRDSLLRLHASLTMVTRILYGTR